MSLLEISLRMKIMEKGLLVITVLKGSTRCMPLTRDILNSLILRIESMAG